MADLRRRAVTISTELGRLRLLTNGRRLVSVELPAAPAEGATEGTMRGGHRLLDKLIAQLQAYAAGQSVRFDVPLDLSAGTVFQQAVWRTLQKIPRGETRSYAWVARQIGKPKAARAVGAACGANPLPIIVPCHRVVASDGSLGGFAGGVQLKRRLLALEKL